MKVVSRILLAIVFSAILLLGVIACKQQAPKEGAPAPQESGEPQSGGYGEQQTGGYGEQQTGGYGQ